MLVDVRVVLADVRAVLAGLYQWPSVPTCFRFRHVNRAGLRLFWAGVRL